MLKAFANGIGKFTPKAFANFSPGFERSENPGYPINKKHLNPGSVRLAMNSPKELDAALRQNPKLFLDTVSTGSDLVNDTSQNHYEYCLLITDQVATAPCTDCVQAQRPLRRIWYTLKLLKG